MENEAPKKKYYSSFELNLGTLIDEFAQIRHPGFKEDITLDNKINILNNNLKDNRDNSDWFYVIWDPYLKESEWIKPVVGDPYVGFKKYMLARRLTDQPTINLIKDQDIGFNGIKISSEYDRELRLFNSIPNIKEVPKEGKRTFYTNKLDQPEQITEEYYKGVLFVTSNLESLTMRMEKLNWSMSFFNPKTPNKVKISKNMKEQNQWRIMQFRHWCLNNYIFDANEIHNISSAII
jgi:hypothetical protein